MDEGALLTAMLGYDRAVQNQSSDPAEGATRFAADGTLEVFDGTRWAPYQPVADDAYGVVFKGAPPPEPPADDFASENR